MKYQGDHKKLLVAFGALILVTGIGIYFLTTVDRYPTPTFELITPSPFSTPLAEEPAQQPLILGISPLTASPGETLTIRGSGFRRENNDIAFTARTEGRTNTAYINSVPSSDGSTLSFPLPAELGACAFSQMKEDEACPAVAIMMPTGNVEINVVNKSGTSNKLNLTIIKSELQKAEDLVYASDEYRKLTELLDKAAAEGGSGSIGIHQCGDKPCIKVEISTHNPNSLKQQIPRDIEGVPVVADVQSLN